MNTLSLLAVLTVGSIPCLAADLPRSLPEAQGVLPADILAFVNAADKIESMNSFMLLRHGKVIAEGWWAPYAAESRHSLYSLSKSFTSTGTGLLISEGKLSLDDEILKFFPDQAPAHPSRNLRAMRVRDLLCMSTGHVTEPPRPAKESWIKAFLAHPVPFKPGTHFLYNTSATYMLSAIVQKITGHTLLDYLKPRLFGPLGIEHPTWETSPEGISCGGFGLSLRTEDIAKFGQLYLQKGKWHDKQLVPAAWIEMATARQTSNGSNPHSDWDQGYGYQFWRCRHGAYRGDGAFGQYCIVMPHQDAVLVITSGVKDMQAVLNTVWDNLLPAFQPVPIPIDGRPNMRLEDRLLRLTLSTPRPSGSAANIWGKKYAFPTNNRRLESLTLEGPGKDGTVTLVCRVGGVEQRIVCGQGHWLRGKGGWGRLPAQPVAASGAWTGDGAYTAKLCFYETPFILTLRLTFTGDEVRCTTEANVGFGRLRQPALVGKAK